MEIQKENGFYSIKGEEVFRFRTLKTLLEYAAKTGISLGNLSFRKVRLSKARLDDLKADGAVFWGARVEGADLCGASLRGCDLRQVNLERACLADADLRDADMRGAYFSGAILAGAKIDGAQISCPSFWHCAPGAPAPFRSFTYCHQGVTRIDITKPPLIVERGNRRMIMLTPDWILCNATLIRPDHLARKERSALYDLYALKPKTPTRKNAKNPIHKIAARMTDF